MLNTGDAITATNARIESFLAQTASDNNHLGADALDFLSLVSTFVTGGKRFRALCTLLGYATTEAEAIDAIIDVAAGLELFHAAALVHDDIMDRSDTRRGRPSMHRAFEADLGSRGLRSDLEHFGVGAALLGGDMLLALSDELITSGIQAQRTTATRTRREFNTMRRDVTMGQYLDILEEVAWPLRDAAGAQDQAIHVLTYKSAKYSIEAPLRIGAALGGASDSELDSLSAVGLPLGIAFQLRDDLLGVFGESDQTGKPVGDDLREGKRTVLIAIALENGCDLTGLGDDTLTTDDVRKFQERLHDCSADAAVERLIDTYVDEAHRALDALPVSDESRGSLRDLATRVTQRTT